MPSSSLKSTTEPINLIQAEKKLKLRFKNIKLLEEAFTHKSYAIEHNCPYNNERLEFLGDSVISAVVAHHLYKRFSNEDEGHLSRIKSQIVSRANLATWADEFNLGQFLFLSQGEEATGGRTRESLLGNAYEALVGAIFLDQGFTKAEKFILRILSKKKRIVETDFKSRLQEIVQKKFRIIPTYHILKESGPDHAKTFSLEVRVNQKAYGYGEGKAKKEAEQMAAKEALKRLK